MDNTNTSSSGIAGISPIRLGELTPLYSLIARETPDKIDVLDPYIAEFAIDLAEEGKERKKGEVLLANAEELVKGGHTFLTAAEWATKKFHPLLRAGAKRQKTSSA
jgi:hypothetical protein